MNNKNDKNRLNFIDMNSKRLSFRHLAFIFRYKNIWKKIEKCYDISYDLRKTLEMYLPMIGEQLNKIKSNNLRNQVLCIIKISLLVKIEEKFILINKNKVFKYKDNCTIYSEPNLRMKTVMLNEINRLFEELKVNDAGNKSWDQFLLAYERFEQSGFGTMLGTIENLKMRYSRVINKN